MKSVNFCPLFSLFLLIVIVATAVMISTQAVRQVNLTIISSYISSYRAERWERRRRRLNPSVSVSWRDATCLLYTHLKHFSKDRWGRLTLARGFLNLDFTLAMEKDLLGLWQSTYLIQSKECHWQKNLNVFLFLAYFRDKNMKPSKWIRNVSYAACQKNIILKILIKSNQITLDLSKTFFLKQLCVYDLVDELVYGQENQISFKNIGFFLKKFFFWPFYYSACIVCISLDWIELQWDSRRQWARTRRWTKTSKKI